MNFPERVFAVGGAGKAIALELLESDWVVDEVLQPRPAPASMTVTIIDTAEGERNTDRQRIQDIRERISERERQLRDSEQGRTGTLNVEYKLITEDLHLSGTIDLLGDDAVPRITAGNGMAEEDWWIEEQHINENLDFAKGVVRKRGLGKALYYKAYAEDDQISSYIDLPQKGQVAMLVGLGGGTGSGIMIDLARHLQRKQRTAEITLFGILPNHTEGRKESTNAFAALSELEYNALHGEGVFKDRVVIPIDPTNFDGKTSNRIQTDRLLAELDEAILYLLVSYYNTEGLEDPFADTPQYAPFTIGIPQVLRYNVEAISDARNQFREVLQVKEAALQQEAEIYDRVEQFLDEHYDTDGRDEETRLRDLDRTDLQERLENITSWLQFDLFDELEYHSVDEFGDIVSEGRESGEDIVEQIDIISGSLRATDTTDQTTGAFVDDIDEHLAEVLERDLALLGRRRDILERRQAIDDSRVRDAVEYVVDVGDTTDSPGVKLQRLEGRLTELRDQRDQYAADLEETTAELERAREEQASEVERRTDACIQAIETEVEQLRQLDLETVETVLSTLDRRLDRFAYDIVNATTRREVDQVPADEVLAAADELERLLDPAGVDIAGDVRAVSESLPALKNAKQAFITMHQEKTTVERLTPWKSSTDEAQDEANRDYRVQKSNLHEQGIFQVGSPQNDFTATITHDGREILQRCRRRRERLTDSVRDSLGDRLDVSGDAMEPVEAELDNPRPDLDVLRDAIERALQRGNEATAELEAERSDLEAQLADIEAEIAVYTTTVDLFQRTNNRREAWVENDRRSRQRLEERVHDTEQEVATREDDYVYVKNIQPEDIFRATGSTDIATSDLFSSAEERQRVRSHLEELARNAQNQQYTGLYRRKVARNRSRYDGLKVRVAAMSPAIDELDAGALDFQQMFQEAFDLGASGKRVESPFASWRQETGGPWDVALSVFVTGVFLDNIRKFVQTDGYQAGYRQRAEKLQDDILIHHGHGLEDGHYVRRADHLNLESDDDVGFYLRDEERIVEDLLADYVETRDT